MKILGDECSKPLLLQEAAQTEEELDRAISAMEVSCIENLRYRGRRPCHPEKAEQDGLRHLCDALEDHSASEVQTLRIGAKVNAD